MMRFDDDIQVVVVALMLTIPFVIGVVSHSCLRGFVRACAVTGLVWGMVYSSAALIVTDEYAWDLITLVPLAFMFHAVWGAFVGLVVGLPHRLLRPHYRDGHCRKCGYNLTGNVSGVCPECGVGIETASESLR